MRDISIPEEEKGWLSAVGLMAVYWATLEQLMDSYILMTLHHPIVLGPDQPERPSIKITFNKRIRLWKDTVSKIPMKAKVIEESLELADRVRTARNHRDLLLHGLSYKAPDGQYFAINPKDESDKPQRIPVPEKKILKVAREIRVATSDLFHHVEQVSVFFQESLRQKYPALTDPRGSRRSPSTRGKS